MKYKIPIKMTVAENLEYSDAVSLLGLCNERLKEFYSFSMESVPLRYERYNVIAKQLFYIETVESPFYISPDQTAN